MMGINVKLALAAIRSAKMRSFLTMVAVIIGVTAFVTITATFEGFKSSVATQINDLGGNLIAVNSGKIVERDEQGEITSVNFAASFGTPTLTEQDLKDIQKLDGVEAVAPQTIITASVSKDNAELENVLLIATNDDYPAAFGQKVEEGEFFDDDSSNDRFAVIGSGVSENFKDGNIFLGSKLKIRKSDFVVIGVMETFDLGGLSFGVDLNNSVIIPYSAGKKIIGESLPIQEIDIQVAEGADVDKVFDSIYKAVLQNHGGDEDFAVTKQDELITVTQTIFDQLKSFSQAVAYIMLFVGAVVILLIMLITVTERTKEIGIRKSIGATNGNVMIQFLTEALVISWIGSVIGILVAWFVGLGVKSAIQVTPEYSLKLLLAVMLISTVVGTIAGIYPAYQAARKDPVEALRHE